MYDYEEAVKDDIKNYLESYLDDYFDERHIDEITKVDDVVENIYDDLFVGDSVTGNASGSYYCNSYKAKEALEGNMDLVAEAYRDFGYEALPFEDIDNPEKVDVTIRCYLLRQCLDEVIKDYEDKIEDAINKNIDLN